MIQRWQADLWPFLDHLAGWVMLVVGSALLATAVLAPAWRTTCQLSRHRDLMKAQTEVIVDQEDAYVRFHAALMDRDPVLIRRLACNQLRLKPAGTVTLALAGGPARSATADRDMGGQDGGVGIWLHRPVDADPHRSATPTPPGPLGTLTSGPARVGVIGCGIVCITIGLLLPIGTRRPEAD